MPTYGPNYPSSASNDSSGGTHAWSGTSNLTADDGSSASVLSSGGETSNFLIANSFGFSVPDGETIVGVTVTYNDKVISFGSVVDQTVKLVVSGAITGTNKSAGAFWDVTSTYGGSSDVWGCSLYPMIVNDSSFGVAIAATSGDTAYWLVDSVTITIETTSEGGGGGDVREPSCTPIGTGTAAGKEVITQISASADDGYWTYASYFHDGHLQFGKSYPVV